MTATSPCPGIVRSGSTSDPAGLVQRGTRATLASGEAATPAAQTTVRAAIRSSPTSRPPSSIPVARLLEPDLDAQRLELPLRPTPRGPPGRSAGPAGRLRAGGSGPGPGRCGGSRGPGSCRATSASVPASSTPVGPAPMITKVRQRAGVASGSGSRSATSKAESTRRRISRASSMLLSPGANRSHSSWPKYECVAAGGDDQVVVGRPRPDRAGPAARSTSIDRTSAIRTRTLGRRADDPPDRRRRCPTGFRAAVAT